MVDLTVLDAGLLGCNVLGLIDCLRRNVMQHNAVAIPYKAVVYCMGVEIKGELVHGFDFSALEKYRWDEQYTTAALDELPCRYLTAHTKAFEFSLDGCQHGRGRETIVRLPVEKEGCMNAVVFWFDLHLDKDTIITTGT